MKLVRLTYSDCKGSKKGTYKTSSLEWDGSPEKPVPIDGNKLRKENWKLGQDSFKYETINKSVFKDINQSSSIAKQTLDEIKERVRGTHVSVKSGP